MTSAFTDKHEQHSTEDDRLDRIVEYSIRETVRILDINNQLPVNCSRFIEPSLVDHCSPFTLTFTLEKHPMFTACSQTGDLGQSNSKVTCQARSSEVRTHGDAHSGQLVLSVRMVRLDLNVYFSI